MSIIQDLVFARGTKEYDEIMQLLLSDTILQKYPAYKEYSQNATDRQKVWALSHRTDLRTRENNTDNYTESMIFVYVLYSEG